VIRLLADENVSPAFIAGLSQRIIEIDIESTHDVGLDGRTDAEVLSWAAEHERVVVSFDRKTLPDHVDERIADGKSVPGVVILRRGYTLREMLDDLELLIRCLGDDEFANRTIRIPYPKLTN